MLSRSSQFFIALVLLFIQFIFCILADDTFIYPDGLPAKKNERKIGDIARQKCLDTYANRPAAKQFQAPKGHLYDAEPMEYLHMAALGIEDGSKTSWVCGGSLISDKFVLTAAHCTHAVPSRGTLKYVRLGDLNLNRDDEVAEPQTFGITRIIRHPEYKIPSAYNDIALIELDRPIQRTDYVQPACLHTELNIPANTKWTTLGWGYKNIDTAPDGHLHVKTLQETEYSVCRQEYNTVQRRLSIGIDNVTQICAANEHEETCQGNSGGPLQIRNAYASGYTVIGVTSLGKACLPNIPSIYTRISHYVGWIESVVWP